MGDGTEKNPYSCNDVLTLIERNLGRARGLDMSPSKSFERGINLTKL